MMPRRSCTGKPDISQMAANLISAVAGELTCEELSEADRAKNPDAVALGRLGGLRKWQGASSQIIKETKNGNCPKSNNREEEQIAGLIFC
jgi:hypothetical protein